MPDLRTVYSDLITSGMHLLLLVFAFRANERRVWIGTLAVISVISFFAWFSTNRRRLAIDDHPTAQVTSAPQGYVELFGTCRIPPGNSPVSLRAEEVSLGIGHAWFRYRVDRRSSDRKWAHVRSGCSEQGFMLDDGTGQCYVDPENAEVVTSHKRVWYEEDYRYTEWFIVPHDELYAIGEFTSVNGGGTVGVSDADMRNLLAQWKKDPTEMVRRFDRNNDGQVDGEEWDEARKAAKEELEDRHKETRHQPSIHMMCAPRDGRVFLISNLDPRRLVRKYLFWAWFHLAVFIAAGAVAVGMAAGTLSFLSR
ncbi:MAG: E3 ubiquitin ligase family protein [Nitrospirota bacterium]|nr:E3 ubiquitin ligase family protein [Nitrospirota bacterium]